MSKIEWTDATWNPVVGCSLASPGCTHCYAMRMASRLESMAVAHATANGGDPGSLGHYLGTTQPSKAGPVWTGRVNVAPKDVLLKPLRRKRPRRIFVNSMSDLFHHDVPDAVIDRVFAVMALCPQHVFQVLTKRSARMREYLRHKWADTQLSIPVERWEDAAFYRVMIAAQKIDPARYQDSDIGGCNWWPLPNVWLGVSVEDQARADERIPDLLATPAAVRWVSAEPLLGPVDMGCIEPGDWNAAMGWAQVGMIDAVAGESVVFDEDCEVEKILATPKLDWVVAGGESGPNARPMHPDWARSLRDQCAAAGVPFFMKQMGRKAPIPDDLFVRQSPSDVSAGFGESSIG